MECAFTLELRDAKLMATRRATPLAAKPTAVPQQFLHLPRPHLAAQPPINRSRRATKAAALTTCVSHPLKLHPMPRGHRSAHKTKPINVALAAAHKAFETMAFDQCLLAVLAAVPNQDNNRHISERIHFIWAESMAVPPHPQLVSNFFSWVGQPSNREALPEPLHKTIKDRRAQLLRLHSRKRRIINLSNLNAGVLDKGSFLTGVPLRRCDRLAQPFPPPLLYVSETPEIYDRNIAFVMERDLPDSRIPRRYIFRLDGAKAQPLETSGLMHDLAPGESARFVDSEGQLVAVVIRNACNDRRVVAFADQAVKEAVRTRRNARKEDRGHISQMGLSAGSRSKPSLAWVRNIERQKANRELHQQVNYNVSSSFAVLWSLARSLLPDPIVNDFEAFINQLGPDVRMDADHTMGTSPEGRGTYHIQISDADFTYHNAELAPPCGVVAENYCRFIHFERQPHKWAVSLTTSRSFDPEISSLEAGGHFFISSYGIRIQAAPNTLIAWRPADWHGTSLFRISPDASSPEQLYYQRGFCIVTGTRVVNAVKKWRAGQLSEDALNQAEDDTDNHCFDDHPQARELEEFVSAVQQAPLRKSSLQHAPLRKSSRLALKPRKTFVGC